MAVAQFFLVCSDVLQFALPTIVGVQDALPQLQRQDYHGALVKIAKIALLVLVQNRGTALIKHISQKPRPSFPDRLDSFPSGHMMIAVQSLVRIAQRDGVRSLAFLLGSVGTVCVGLGRYLPGKHDVVDLTFGALGGVGLGLLWNKVV